MAGKDDDHNFEYPKDSVSAVSVHRKIRNKYHRNPELLKTPLNKLFFIYKNPDITDDYKQEVRDEIFLKTFFLIPYTIKKQYFLSSNLLNDAVQNMAYAILQAIDKFDPYKGTSFTDYLVGYFRGAMSQTFRDMNTVALPHACKRSAKNKKADFEDSKPMFVQLEAETAPPPNEDDADHTTHAPTSEYTDNSVYRGSEHLPSFDFEAYLHNKQLVECLEDFLLSPEANVLTPDERLVLRYHHGLFRAPQKVYKEIAEIRKKEGKGCATSRISQIHSSAIEKLRAYFKKLGLEPY